MSADRSSLSVFRRPIADAARAAALLSACILLIFYREAAGRGVLSGISTCLNHLIPALFPFVILACLLVQTRAVQILCRPLAFVVRRVLRLPNCAAPVLLFGLTLGYPIGARLTAALYEKGHLTKRETARLLCCCTAPGYAFSLYAGALLGGKACGVLLFVSCLLAPLLFGLLTAPFSPKPTARPDADFSSGSFTSAVRDGVSAMVSMCGFLTVFAGIAEILQSAGVFRMGTAFLARLGVTVPTADALLRFLLEVTGGVAQCAYWRLSPALAAFGLGFAGVCIHLQIFSFFKKPPMRFSVYFGARLLNGLFCAAVYSALARLFPRAVETAGTVAPLTRVFVGDPALSAALLLLSVFFLLSCTSRLNAADFARR